MPRDRLSELISEAWVRPGGVDAGVLTPPGMPILWFGDLDGYQRSQLRIITVGLNPSDAEFPQGSYERFPKVNATSGFPSANRYKSALNDYFRVNPYRKWFCAYERILNRLDATYFDQHSHVAIHTDICSVWATTPRWSKLDPTIQATLAANGKRLWFDLVRCLRPHLVLVSVSRRWTADVIQEFRLCPKRVCEFKRTRSSSIVDAAQCDSLKSVFVFASAGRQPLAPFKNSELDQVRLTLRHGRLIP